jgi:hypothetical protein
MWDVGREKLMLVPQVLEKVEERRCGMWDVGRERN